jgi:replicative DNA helicase
LAAEQEPHGRKGTRSPQDRTPPHSIEAERSVLGAMLLDAEAVVAAIEIFGDKSTARDIFYLPAHQHVYEAVWDLFRRDVPVDHTTLLEKLMQEETLEKAGGVSYLSELLGAVPTAANAQYYARIVMNRALQRRLIAICNNIAMEAYSGDDDVSALLDTAERDIFQIAEQRQLNPIYPVASLVDSGVQQIEEQLKSSTGITGLPTGFKKLDEMLSGLQPSDMIVLAARPSVGKTAFALNIANHVATHEKKAALIFSLEMAKEQLVQRLLCMVGHVDSARLRTGFLAGEEFPKVQQAAGILKEARLYLDDTPNISVLELRSKARRHISQHPVDLLIIDYLQLMSGAGRMENRQVEIADISRAIKGLARELSIPVIALSQLNREAEKDDTGMPKLSHIRESGAIEQDADVVMMLSRLPAHESEGRENVVKLNVAKQRNGPTGPIELLFQKNVQRFCNLVEDGGANFEPPPGEAAFDAVDFDDTYEEDDAPFDAEDDLI